MHGGKGEGEKTEAGTREELAAGKSTGGARKRARRIPRIGKKGLYANFKRSSVKSKLWSRL